MFCYRMKAMKVAKVVKAAEVGNETRQRFLVEGKYSSTFQGSSRRVVIQRRKSKEWNYQQMQVTLQLGFKDNKNKDIRIVTQHLPPKLISW